jgi:cbb3-type cytochrome oxidase subunit 3
MMYFWLITLFLFLVVAVAMMFRNGTKNSATASRLDHARSDDLHS